MSYIDTPLKNLADVSAAITERQQRRVTYFRQWLQAEGLLR